tara:strand:- start:2735 stop:2983 length:249 start_codon:yes stop_codon:yes gene_type:complete
MCPFSKYKHILGIPGKGLHKYNILGTAIFDYVLTIILAFVWTALTGFPLVFSTVMWFIIGFILHILFGVETHAVKYLGIKCN